MSRVNKFQEGHGPPKKSWDTPAKKRKRRRKPEFSLSNWDYAPFWAAAKQRKRTKKR